MSEIEAMSHEHIFAPRQRSQSDCTQVVLPQISKLTNAFQSLPTTQAHWGNDETEGRLLTRSVPLKSLA
jgi:hypothetical protein